MKAEIIMTLKNVEFVEKNIVCMPIQGCKEVVKCYAIYLEEEESKKVGFLTYEVVKEMGLSLKELDKLAVENTLNRFVPVLYSVGEYLSEMLAGEAKAKNYFSINDSDYKIDWSEGEMFTLTNDQAFLGASLIAIPKVREKLLGLFKEDLIIIPSSVHEIIIIPSGVIGEQQLNEQIKDVNGSYVSAGDVLSDKAYLLKYR